MVKNNCVAVVTIQLFWITKIEKKETVLAKKNMIGKLFIISNIIRRQINLHILGTQSVKSVKFLKFSGRILTIDQIIATEVSTWYYDGLLVVSDKDKNLCKKLLQEVFEHTSYVEFE